MSTIFSDISNREHFYVVYDGPALAEHLIDVPDLSPSLFAIADLLSAANEELNDDSAKVHVEIKEILKIGSFRIDLVFRKNLRGGLRKNFASQYVPAPSSISDIMHLLGISGQSASGLIGLLRMLRSRRPIRVKRQGAVATVWAAENESFKVDRQVFCLWQSHAVRSSLEKILSPLSLNGISKAVIVQRNRVILEINETELDYFSSTTKVGARQP